MFKKPQPASGVCSSYCGDRVLGSVSQSVASCFRSCILHAKQHVHCTDGSGLCCRRWPLWSPNRPALRRKGPADHLRTADFAHLQCNADAVGDPCAEILRRARHCLAGVLGIEHTRILVAWGLYTRRAQSPAAPQTRAHGGWWQRMTRMCHIPKLICKILSGGSAEFHMPIRFERMSSRCLIATINTAGNGVAGCRAIHKGRGCEAQQRAGPVDYRARQTGRQAEGETLIWDVTYAQWVWLMRRLCYC